MYGIEYYNTIDKCSITTISTDYDDIIDNLEQLNKDNTIFKHSFYYNDGRRSHMVHRTFPSKSWINGWKLLHFKCEFNDVNFIKYAKYRYPPIVDHNKKYRWLIEIHSSNKDTKRYISNEPISIQDTDKYERCKYLFNNGSNYQTLIIYDLSININKFIIKMNLC